MDVNLRTVGSGTAVRETLATLGLEKTEKAVLLAVVTEEFHPEKSGKTGEKILTNFLNL